MAAMAGLAGSTTVGKRVQVGGKAGFSGHLEVGDDIVSPPTPTSPNPSTNRGLRGHDSAAAHADWVKNFPICVASTRWPSNVRELEKKLAEQDKKS